MNWCVRYHFPVVFLLFFANTREITRDANNERNNGMRRWSSCFSVIPCSCAMTHIQIRRSFEFSERTTRDATHAFFVVSHANKCSGGYRKEPAQAPVSWHQTTPSATSNARMWWGEVEMLFEVAQKLASIKIRRKKHFSISAHNVPLSRTSIFTESANRCNCFGTTPTRPTHS